MLFQILCRPAVMIPVRVVQLNEPHASFDQSPRKQAVIGE